MILLRKDCSRPVKLFGIFDMRYIFEIFNVNDLSVASIAKAQSISHNPSILMTKVCLRNTPFSMGTSSLFFTKLESGEKSLDMNLFPNKGTNSNHLTIFILKTEAYIEKILQIKIKIYIK